MKAPDRIYQKMYLHSHELFFVWHVEEHTL